MAMYDVTEQFKGIINSVNRRSAYSPYVIIQTPIGYTVEEVDLGIRTASTKLVGTKAITRPIDGADYLVCKSIDGIITFSKDGKLVTYSHPAIFNVTYFGRRPHDFFSAIAEYCHRINYDRGEAIEACYGTDIKAFHHALNRKREYPKTVPAYLDGNHDYWRDVRYEPIDEDDDTDDFDDDDADREAAELENSRRERIADVRNYYHDRI